MSLINFIQYKSDILKNYKLIDLFIISLVFIIYMTILWDFSIAKNCYSILSLIALYQLATKQLNIDLTKLEKVFLGAIAASFTWIVITYFINGMPERGGHWIINVHLRMLMIIPIYLMLRNQTISVNLWWFFVSFGSIVAGSVAIAEVTWANGWPVGRAGGDTSAIYFGEISLCLAFVTLIGIRTYFSTNMLTIILWLISVSLGILAMILAGSRGAWIAIPVLIIIASWYLTKDIAFYKKLIVLVCLLSLPIIMFQFPYAQTRYHNAEKQITEYIESENILDPAHNLSVGLRLDAWKVMLLTIKENPFFGIGIGGFKEEINKYADKGMVHPDPVGGGLHHSHNQYIEIAVYSGVIGLLLNLGILISPLIIFLKFVRSNVQSHQPFAVAGLMLIASYLIFGITDLTLTKKIHIIFYGLSISILLSILTQMNNKVMSSEEKKKIDE